MAPGFITDLFAGNIPLNFLLPFIGLVGVPTSCSIAGITKKRRQATRTQSFSLWHLFFGVEMPLLIFCTIRFFMLRDLMAVSSFFLIIGVVGTMSYIHWFFSDPATENIWINGLQLAGLTLGFGLSFYGLIISAFFFPVLIFTLMILPYLVVIFPIGVFIFGCLAAPLGISATYYRAWRQALQHLSQNHGQQKIRGFAAGVLALGILTTFSLQQQPQLRALEQLKTAPTIPQAQQELVQQSGEIRRGLLNAYLSQYRYLYDQDNSLIRYLYAPNSNDSFGDFMQSLYNWVTTPFNYRGNFRDDSQKAAELYAQFFDQPIQRAELPAIEKALNSTFDRNAAKAGLNDINAKRVWLEEQNLTVTPHGDWAEVELYEVYDNRTDLDEEILYYFSLPESAAVTGLWLGESPDLNNRYRFVVSPRGAAQKVYTDQVHRINPTDPALLEQVGPRNYRLRAFPILPRGRGKMHLWLTYKVLKQDEGWAMPVLHEKRNLFWTGASKRLLNGKSVSAQDQWLPDFLPVKNAAKTAGETDSTIHQMPLSENANILAVPYGQDKLQLPQGKRLALVLDGSYSMNQHQKALAQTVKWLEQRMLTQNQADLYLTASDPTQSQRLDDIQTFDPRMMNFYGSMEPREMLSQFLDLRQGSNYDAILFITDPGSYELSRDDQTVLEFPAPLWFVHLDGLQFAYDDATLQAIQDSGGGISTDISEVAYRLGTQPSLGEGTSFINLVDGYAWFLSQDANASSSKDIGFYPLATRQWIAQLGEAVKPGELNQLDTIHNLAKTYEVVTPYSSMLVLVNDVQRDALKNAEQQSDRFNRELEDQQLPQPSSTVDGSVVGVPEPSEWMLIAVAMGLLAVFGLRRRPKSNQQETMATTKSQVQVPPAIL